MPQEDYFSQFKDVGEDYFAQFPTLEETTVPEKKTEGKSTLGKVWDWANTSLLKGSFIDPRGELTQPTPEDWMNNPVYSSKRAMGSILTSPLGIAGGLSAGRMLGSAIRNRPRILPPVKPPQKMLPSGSMEVTPNGTVRGSRNVTSIREQLGGKLPDVPMNRVKDIYNPSGKLDEVKVFESAPQKIKVTASDASAYMEAVKTGQIPKGTTFAAFKERLSKLATEETGAVRIGRSDPKEALPKGVTKKQFDKVQTDVINALRSGDLINLNQIARNSGIPRRQFDKLIDKVIQSGTLNKIKPAVEAKQNQAVVKLLHALDTAKPLREQQEAIYSAERSRRFAAFESVKTPGLAGANEKLGKLAGEMPKIAPIQLQSTEVDELFNMIHNARILPGEKAHAISGLKKILDGTGLPQRSELALLDKVYGQGFVEHIIEMHGGIGAVGKIKDVGVKLTKTSNTMKSMSATIDASAPLRQGFGLMYRKEFWKSWKDMYGYMDETKFNALNKAIEERPTYLLGRESGLYLAGKELGKREEQFLASYLDDLALGKIGVKGHKIPESIGQKVTFANRGAERMYVGFLNKLRADTFDNLLKNAIKAGHNPKEIAPKIAKYVNTMSGRGDLYRGFNYQGKQMFNLNKVGDELNTIFFSPRLISSRLTMLNPKYYWDAPKFIRMEALKSWMAMGTFVAVANGLGRALGGENTINPLNSDLGKIKFGDNTRLDPAGGLSQFIVAAAKTIMGKSISPTSQNVTNFGENYTSPNRLGNLFNIGGNQKSFLENKLSPMASLIDVLVSQKDFSGQPPDTKKEILSKFVPIIMQDFAELVKEDPDLLWLMIPAAHGMGAQTFEPRQRQMNLNAPSMNMSLTP